MGYQVHNITPGQSDLLFYHSALEVLLFQKYRVPGLQYFCGRSFLTEAIVETKWDFMRMCMILYEVCICAYVEWGEIVERTVLVVGTYTILVI